MSHYPAPHAACDPTYLVISLALQIPFVSSEPLWFIFIYFKALTDPAFLALSPHVQDAQLRKFPPK